MNLNLLKRLFSIHSSHSNSVSLFSHRLYTTSNSNNNNKKGINDQVKEKKEQLKQYVDHLKHEREMQDIQEFLGHGNREEDGDDDDDHYSKHISNKSWLPKKKYRFPQTNIRLYKKINSNSIKSFLLKDFKSYYLLNSHSSNSSNNKQRNIFDFGKGNTIVDKNFEKGQKEKEGKVRAEYLENKRNDYYRALQQHTRNQYKWYINKQARHLKQNRERVMLLANSKTVYNRVDPFENYFNVERLDKVIDDYIDNIEKEQEEKYIEKYKTLNEFDQYHYNYPSLTEEVNQDQDEDQDTDDGVDTIQLNYNIQYRDRVDLHLYSLFLYHHNNMYKEVFPMIYDNLQSLILDYQDKLLINESIEKEDFLEIVSMADETSESVFRRSNRVYNYFFKQLADKKKRIKFFQALESQEFNCELESQDYKKIVQALLEMRQFDSAEMVTQNMLDNRIFIDNDIFIAYLEYYRKDPELGQDNKQIFDAFVYQLKSLSTHYKDGLEYHKEKEFDKEVENQDQEEEDEDEEDNIAIRDQVLFEDILVYCYKNRLMEVGEQIEDFMEQEGIYPNMEIFNAKVKLKALEGEEISQRFLNDFSLVLGKKFKGNSHTFISMLHYELIKNKNPYAALSLLKEYKKKWSLKMNSFIYNQLIYGLARINDLPNALKYYSSWKKLGESKTVTEAYLQQKSAMMNESIILYCMAYYDHDPNSIIEFIKSNSIQITTPILDLIIYGYLIENKFRLEKYNSSNKKSTGSNSTDHLIVILDYLVFEQTKQPLDLSTIQFISSKLKSLKTSIKIQPTLKENLKKLKNLLTFKD
ncbi:hypothetical protein CYY_004288 [Polysphondylium violaceum]|uniref:Uncharacterized protein n=1 Tax=Polysphondylium violaceum TaxID=133409 RepID=A0A8J4PVE0_9MYCE|nr:hypothetical protein CYY_004288 [Polysphondylium violaceum]